MTVCTSPSDFRGTRPRPPAQREHGAVEGAGHAETADPTGAARVASRPDPRPPRPPVRHSRKPLETGSRPIPCPPLPPALAAFHTSHRPDDYALSVPEKAKLRGAVASGSSAA